MGIVDTIDMEKHRVDLRITLGRHMRRFQQAQQRDVFEEIVTTILNKNQPEQAELENSLKLTAITRTSLRDIDKYLTSAVKLCASFEQVNLLEKVLRIHLQDLRRKAVLTHKQEGNTATLEPFCLSRASNLSRGGGGVGPDQKVVPGEGAATETPYTPNFGAQSLPANKHTNVSRTRNGNGAQGANCSNSSNSANDKSNTKAKRNKFR